MAGLTKKDLKEVFIESLEPFAEAIQKDFDRIDRKIAVEGMRIDNRLAKLDFDVQEVKKDVKWMRDHTSELFKKLDDIIAMYKKQEQEMAILNMQYKRLEERVAKLEGRGK